MDFEKEFDLPVSLDHQPIKDAKKDETDNKLKAKDFLLSTLSSILIMVVLALGNGFVDAKFKFELVFTWNMGLIVVFNWIGGIALSYSMRQNGIKLAMSREEYIKAENNKQEAFAKIKDYTKAQKILDTQIDNDYMYRKSVVENNIAKQIQHLLPEGEIWKQGKPLPKKSSIKVKLLSKYLNSMAPPQLSLIELSERETSVIPKSMFSIPSDPTVTGAKWFATRGIGKIITFSIGPILLSILSGALTGGATFKSFMMIIGTLAIMLFNSAYAFATSYDTVIRKGVDRLRRITNIIKMIKEE